ncbi:MAG: AAA family ATPase [Euryarchaeota archaeon]|nr:AAA family ATPase [Euryarchaeota archaeon]MDE1880671.1 AAA family ATPase [Euryarchaeota archaeon]
MSPVAIERIPTFVEGLDPRMGGGVPKGSVILIEGSAGCMKSSLSYNILFQNALHHSRNGLYLTIEQPRKDIEDQMAALGMDKAVDKALDSRLTVIDLGELRAFLSEAQESELDVDWFRSVLNQVNSFRRDHPLDLFVLDSLNGLLALCARENPRLEIFHFIKELKSYPMTSILISEVAPGTAWSGGPQGFLADGIIHLEAKRVEDILRLQLGVVKMRKTAHEKQYFPFLVRKGGFEIVGK